MLGIITGAVGPFAAFNDADHKVKVYIDAEYRTGLMDAHPNDNGATMFLKADDVLRLLWEFGAEADYIELLFSRPDRTCRFLTAAGCDGKICA